LCQFDQYTHPLFFLGLQLFYPTDVVPLFVTLVEGTSGPLTRFLLHPLLARLAEDDLILTLFPSNGGANSGANGGFNDVSAAALVAVAVNFLVSASNHDLVEGGGGEQRSRDVQKSEANRRDLSSSLIEVILCVQKHLLSWAGSHPGNGKKKRDHHDHHDDDHHHDETKIQRAFGHLLAAVGAPTG